MTAFVAVLRAQRGLEMARRLAASGSWSHPLEHLRTRTALRSAEERREAAQLKDTDLQAYADQLISGALMGLRTVGGRFGSTRHQLHPEVDAYLDVLLEAVVDEVAQRATELANLLTAAFGGARPTHRSTCARSSRGRRHPPRNRRGRLQRWCA